MKKIALLGFLLVGSLTFSFNASAQCSSNANRGKAMKVANKIEKDVVDIAIGSADHTTLVAAVQAADLVGTLKSDGPFTIFAPTNSAFDKLPEGTVATLLKPENKDQLTSILTYHVIAGNYDSGAVVEAIKKNGGSVKLETVQGGRITAMMQNGNVMLKDENGGMATITAVDLKGRNGVIHVIDSVVLPK